MRAAQTYCSPNTFDTRALVINNEKKTTDLEIKFGSQNLVLLFE